MIPIIFLERIETAEDKQKFERIYDKFSKLIYYKAMKMANSKEIGEDIAQEIFLYIVKNIKNIRYDNDKEFSAFIDIIALHCGTEYLNKNNRHHNFVLDDVEEESIVDDRTEKVIFDRETLSETIEIIRNMDSKYSVPLQLFATGYKINEISELLGITPANVRVRIHRARKIISERLNGNE